MDDLEIDRALREALSVAPSPEFVARVRAKVAESPRPSIVTGWLKPAAAVIGAVVLAIAVGLQQQREAPLKHEAQLKPQAQLKLSPTERVPRPIEAPATAGLKPSTTTDQPRMVRTVATPTPDAPLPEVIIPADDVKALLQFVSGARDLQFVASFDETPASVPWVMTDLSIAPIAGDAVDPTPVHNN